MCSPPLLTGNAVLTPEALQTITGESVAPRDMLGHEAVVVVVAPGSLGAHLPIVYVVVETLVRAIIFGSISSLLQDTFSECPEYTK